MRRRYLRSAPLALAILAALAQPIDAWAQSHPDFAGSDAAIQYDRVGLQSHDAWASGPERSSWGQRLALFQGTYYVATGLWPILDMSSFESVTGPKTDDWLVRTVGAVLGVLGGALLVTGLDDGPSDHLAAVGAGSAAALAAIDVIYVAKGRISRIYLLDAAVEVALVAGWAVELSDEE